MFAVRTVGKFGDNFARFQAIVHFKKYQSNASSGDRGIIYFIRKIHGDLRVNFNYKNDN